MTTAYIPFPSQMVSHPQPPPPYSLSSTSTVTLQPPPRRPSSISSRSTSHTHSRRHGHRSGRSHHGGSTSHRPQNEFPNFAQTGDVEIVLNVAGQERRYMLHRLILAQCSRVLERGMSAEWAGASTGNGAQQGSLARIREEDEGRQPAGQRPTWRYELDWGAVEGEVPMLVQKPPSSAHQSLPPPPIPNRPPMISTLPLRSMANLPAMNSTMSIPQQALAPSNQDSSILQDYDNLLRIFYNHPPHLDSLNIATTYLQCKSLLLLADMYDALEVVGPRIDHHLLQFQSRLWKQIAKYPPSYLKLGYLARSKAIFQEALCHVVGQWPSGSRQLSHNSVPEAVLDLIEDKVDELTEAKAEVEARLWRLNLFTSRGERVGPGNAYIDWLALSLFRQYLGENLSPTSTHHRAPPQPSSFYRSLHASGQSYLSHDECKKFLRLAPLPDRDTSSSSRETIKRFERKLDELKTQAREAVRPLMRSYLELDLGVGAGLGYLTCTRIEEEDFPWD